MGGGAEGGDNLMKRDVSGKAGVFLGSGNPDCPQSEKEYRGKERRGWETKVEVRGRAIPPGIRPFQGGCQESRRPQRSSRSHFTKGEIEITP